jgi:anthranilate synthase component 2
MHALLIDAYDSFIYIIADYLRVLKADVTVVRNDHICSGDIEHYGPDLIVLGPGPGHPSDAGYVEILKMYAGRLPILGVCLGHQAIGLAFGAKVIRSPEPRHGKTSLIDHDGLGSFSTIPTPFRATRYHSLVIDRESHPANLIATAKSRDDEQVMAVRHARFAIEGLQFHPESVYTDDGLKILAGFISAYVSS